MFSDNFKNISTDEISNQIKDKGYFFCNDALNKEFLKKILSEANPEYQINFNDNLPVSFFGQKFNTSILATSLSCYQLITDKKVRDISKLILGGNYRLKAQRYYESGHKYRLGWHTDNKAVGGGITNSNGIVFIYYFSNTFDGQLEVVEGSHKFSLAAGKNSFSDDEIRQKYSNNTRSFPGPAGSLIITHTHLIHGTKKIEDKNFIKKSLFFQIDDDIKNAEKKYINPAFMTDHSSEILNFLGVGMPDNYRCVPQTNLVTASNKFLLEQIASIVKQILIRIFKLSQLKKIIYQIINKK